MFQRLVSMLLCSCILAGNTSEAAYVTPLFGNYAVAQEESASIEGMTLEQDASEAVFGETTEEAEGTEESTETSGEASETTEESTEESGETPETTEESTEESGEIPETTEESTEESEEVSETIEETATETIEETIPDETETENETTTEETVPEFESDLLEESDAEAVQSENDSDIVLTEGEAVQVALESGDAYKKYFVFTAPKAGYYAFKGAVDKNYANMYLCNDKTGSTLDGIQVFSSPAQNLVRKMEAGAVIYVKVNTYAAEAPTFTLTVSAVSEAVLTAEEDGSYQAVYGDNTVDIEVEPGLASAVLNVTLTAGDNSQLDSQYKIGHRRVKKNSSGSTSGVMKLSDTEGYSNSTVLYNLSMDTEYELSLNLLDADNNVIAVLVNADNPVIFKTDYAEEGAILSVGTVTYNTAEIEYEKAMSGMKGYYAPVSAPEKKKSFTYLSDTGKMTRTLYNLDMSTEYRVWIETRDGDVAAEQSFTTTALSIEAEYEIIPGAGDVTVEANVSEYGGTKDSLYVVAAYTDADGVELKTLGNISLESDGESKKGSGSCTVEGLLAETTYSLTVWIQEGEHWYSNYPHYAEETQSVTTIAGAVKAEDVIFSVTQNENTPSTMDYTITFPVQKNTIKMEVDCGAKGESDWEYGITHIAIVGETNISGRFEGLMEGVEYEVRLRIPDYGICKTITYQMGTSVYEPKVTDDTDAFESILTYQLEAEKETLEDSTWYVAAWYRSSDKLYSMLIPKTKLTAESGYKLEVKTGSHCILVPDTDYTIRWVLYKDEESSSCYTNYQEIHTKKDGFTIKENSIGISECIYTLNIKARTENLTGQSLSMYLTCREAGGGTVATESNTVTFFGTDGITTGTFRIDGLKPKTSYDIIVNSEDDEGNEDEYTSFTFTTPADDRVLEVNNVKPYMGKAKLSWTLSGNAEDNMNYILAYFREKGCTTWEKQTYINYGIASDEIDFSSYEDAALKADTAYEYVIGLGKGSSTPRSCLTKTIEGEFKTLSDDRELSIRTVPYLQSADIYFELSGAAAEEYPNYMILYYKEKNSESYWGKIYCYETSEGTYKSTISRFDGKALKKQTTYEYVAGLGETSSTTKDELIKTVEGEVTTDHDRRTVQNVQIQSEYGTATVQAEYADNIYKIQSSIYFFYKEEGTQDWQLKKVGDFFDESETFSFTIGDEGSLLKAGTSYDYALVITNYWDEISSPDEVTIDERKVVGTFATKKSDYTLEIVPDDENSTYNKEVLNVTAKDSTEDAKLYVTLSLDNGMTKKVGLSQLKDYKNTITFTGLTENTTYTVTEAVLSVYVNSSELVIDTLEPDVSFTTKKAKAPEEITLSDTELALNAAGTGEGIKWQMLTVDVTPEDAAEDVEWSSSDTKVATVSSDGKVTAVGSGNAVITATSCFDETITASCNVTVESYVVAENVDGVITKITSKQLYKGDSLSSLGLYKKVDNNTFVPVDDFTVTPKRSGVVKWEDGKLTGTASGATDVIFEKDGVKAVLTVQVSVKAKGFGIVGLSASNADYPAIETADGNYEIACVDGVTYTAKGEISPAAVFEATEFEWISSDETVVTVTDGVIKPLKAGNATITVTPKGETSPYIQEQIEIQLDVRELPTEGAPEVYALTNLKKNMTLADVPLPDGWEEGWEWENPKTKLYSLPVNKDAYPFEVVYKGTDKYETERIVNVYIGTVTGLNIYEVKNNHNKIIQVSKDGETNADQMILCVEPKYTGALCPDLQSYLEVTAKSGINVRTDEETGRFIVTASKKGSYTLKPSIKINTGKKDAKGNDILQTLAKSTYKIKAVEAVQAYSISITSNTDDVVIDKNKGRITLDWSEETSEQLKGKKIELSATVKDRNGNEVDTVLEWKITDTSVATVKYTKKNSHQATVTIKGDGHAELVVKAKDATGYTSRMGLEIRDHSPRVNKSTATINLAYDYNTTEGCKLGEEAGGVIEIAGVYGETIQSVALYKEDGETPETDITVKYYAYGHGYKQYIVEPVKEDIPTGNYKCKLAVVTSGRTTPYMYTLQVKVVDNALKVTVKMSETPNLFYLTKTGSIVYNISGKHGGIEKVVWEDNSEAINNGFEIGSVYSASKNKPYVSDISHKKVAFVNGKLADPDVATGTLKVKLYGVREPIEVKNFKIGYTYKKPSLKTVSSTSSISPVAGNRMNQIKIYDNLSKQTLSYSKGNTAYYCYDEISCNSEHVSISTSGEYVHYTYNGNANKETIILTVDSPNWRESLEVKHTIKAVKPTAVLTKSTLTYNKAYKSEQTTYVKFKHNTCYADLCDLEIKGVNAKAQALIDKDIFEIVQGVSENYSLEVKLNQVNLMKEDVAAGTYTFKLTPYYTNTETGEKTALNTLKLKLKVVNKAVTVKVSTKGTLDLAKSTQTYTDNSIALKAKFANLGDGCTIVGAKLKGEYNKYFKLFRPAGTSISGEEYTYSPENPYYIKIANYGKLKANHTYKLSIVYTIRTSSGDEFKVESNVFKVKPKQTAPKVTITNNNQTMYVANELKRYYSISVPTGYEIENAYGSLDCNKDGKADISVALYRSTGTDGMVYVTILDADAITTGKNGKSYSIPLTVQLTGRDGLSKDAKATIKVKIKR